MKILYSLIRLFFYYILFLFLFRAVVFFVKLLLHRPGKHEKEDIINESYKKGGQDRFDYENVVDAEFKEIKK